MNPNRRSFLTTCGAVGSLVPVSAARELGSSLQDGWPSTFPALGQRINGHPLTFLDSAATTLRPQSVIDAIADYYATDNANPSRVHTLARRAGERLAQARQAVARFINAPDPTEIVFVRGTTEGLNLVARTWAAANVRPGDDIILTIAEHASNLLPWTRLAAEARARIRIVDVDDEGQPKLEHLKSLLSSRTRLVAFSHVSNVLGYVNPAREMCALARHAGARTVIDGAQSVPHIRIDVQDLQCDFYVFSGHKMLGPMGTGVVWGRRELLDAMPPFHVGSNMAHDVDVDHAAYEHGAAKFRPARLTSPAPSGWRRRCSSSTAPARRSPATTKRSSVTGCRASRASRTSA